ncbi:glycerophosphoryl diester phosphodiesterase [Nocardioides exalbidus]|uniref:Glycerophosphoryl diester phosphodiesterase n=1 Tax=Nocardioides exalbidus TaxID=402596 RepID=A0A1H4MFD1_9ACTN|nr:glycerophosphoryl diester phosphodiesterase membrane domain-containing protein [Nocardioides exalbidus]SEB81414.1 glycerophosphoryl diester phosphodiesterase [Nocardioides exalbidus]
MEPLTGVPPTRVATRVLRRHLLGYLVVVALVHAFVLGLGMPLLGRLFDLVLDTVDDGAVNMDSLTSVLTSPLTILVLLVFGAVSVALVFVELTVLTLCAQRHLEGGSLSVRGLAEDFAHMVRKLTPLSFVLFALYAVFLLPLANVGITSGFTTHIAVPAFIGGELTKTTGGTLAWWTVNALIVYLALRLLLTLAIFLGSERSLPGAMRDSLRATGWVPWRPAVTLLGVLAVVLLALGLVSGLAVLVTALADTVGGSDSAWWAGFSLALVDLSRFLVLGVAAAWVTLWLVSWERDLTDEPDVPPRRLRSRTRRVVAGLAVVVSAGFLVIGTIAHTADLRTVRDPAATVVVGHRGYTAEGVENTIPALEAAAAAGADVVEMDVLETKDQQLVVMHDPNLGRLAGQDVDVWDRDLDQLVGTPLRAGGHEAVLPSFEEYAARAEELDVRLLVELKPHGHEAPGFAERVAADFAALDIPDDWLVQSLDRDLVEQVGELVPQDVGYVVPFNLGALPATSADFVVVEDWSYSDRIGREGRDAGKDVWIWTVNDTGLLRAYIRRGVDGIITDRVGAAVVDRDFGAAVASPVGQVLDGIMRILGPRS